MAEKKTSKKTAKKVMKKAPAKKAVVAKTTTDKKVQKPKKKVPGFLKPFVALGRYFKGSWQELKQVRWPNRRATWSLTIAVLLFTAFFTVLIVALDAGFEYILNRILL